jgi:hypothetical protein
MNSDVLEGLRIREKELEEELRKVREARREVINRLNLNKNQIDWCSEERIDIIGQNGNEGLHYEKE